MKRAAGFTLIELVIVIVILGILGAVAAPRFINLQDDAYAANINALKGSIQSAATLANTRAVLDGMETTSGADSTVSGFEGVDFKDGFPIAGTEKDKKWDNGILGALQDFDYGAYTVAASGTTAIIINPTNRKQTDCQVSYTEANDKTPPKITADTTGC